MPKSAAVAETPQVPELRLRWHRPRGLGEGGGASAGPGTHCSPHSSFLQPCPHRPPHSTPTEHLPGSSQVLQRATGNPSTPGQGTPAHDGLSTRHKLQPRQEDDQPVGKGPEVGRAGLGRQPIQPPPAGAEGQRGRNREAGRPASCPALRGFPYRFYRSASEAGSNWPQAINYKLVRGGEDRRRHFHIPAPISGGNSCSVQDGPQNKPGAWREPGTCPCLLGRPLRGLPLEASLSPSVSPGVGSGHLEGHS